MIFDNKVISLKKLQLDSLIKLQLISLYLNIINIIIELLKLLIDMRIFIRFQDKYSPISILQSRIKDSRSKSRLPFIHT